MTKGTRVAFLLGLAASVSACASSGTDPVPSDRPFVRILGTAQDGGFPHAACACPRCEGARSVPARRRLVASLAIAVPGEKKVFLVDATPDLREQLDRIADLRDAPAGRVDRAPVDGIFLTHAHLGHYTGLAFLGYEAVASSRIPIRCSPRMAAFLRGNGPWAQLVAQENVLLVEVGVGEPVPIGGGVSVSALPVPHREEWSDTVAWRIEGPGTTVLYVPDTDGWDAWDPPLLRVLAGVDVAILDGTFHSAEELPGRDVASIGHPLVEETMRLLSPEVRAGRLRVIFTHFNHSNPLVDPESSARRAVLDAGFEIAEDGAEIPL